MAYYRSISFLAQICASRSEGSLLFLTQISRHQSSGIWKGPQMSADDLKALGNKAFSAGNFDEAITAFSDAIKLAPDNHVLYSNRSASYASLKRYEEALEDAKKVTSIKPDWPKGYSRLGAANMGLGHLDEAVQAYSQGLQHDPDNAGLKSDLEAAQADQARKKRGHGLFGAQMLAKLAVNPKTSGFLQQPDFMRMMQDINNHPDHMGNYLGDPRFQMALERKLQKTKSWLQVGMGLSMRTADDDLGMNGHGPASGDEAHSQPSSQAATQAASASKPVPKDEPEVVPMDEDVDPETKARQEAEAEAQREKEAGNAAYKQRQFEEALRHYDRALELNDKDISFLTNKAAVQFEMSSYDDCIATCNTAVERGRELRADYKQVAKALTRKGNALVKKGDLEDAIEVYHKALTEHRNPDTLKRLNETERKMKEKKLQDYINMDLSNEEREKGNQAFKDQNYPEAVKHYTEALERGPPSVNPEAHKLFSNRAACYTKLGAWDQGLKDADKCIELKPDFPKGYSRKGHLQFFMKDHDKALETYQEGLKHEPNSEELKEGVRRCMEHINKLARGDASEEELEQRRAKAMQDPEVQNILTDPVMRQVLQDLQENPKQSQHHLKNQQIANKLQKLVRAGIVRMG